MRIVKTLLFVLLLTQLTAVKAQGTLPIFSDYLSDNVYLLHPAAAGIGNCGKLRLSAGRFWQDNELQTASLHAKFNQEGNAAFGVVLFNDKNGFHSQKAIQATYAYHLPLSDGRYFEQLSFGLSFNYAQNQSDQRTFNDPRVAPIIESTSYYNADFGLSYHNGGLSTYFTVKNLLLSARNNLNSFEPLDLRNYVISAGYYFGRDYPIQLEPSFMVQFREGTGERILDLNIKAYKTLNNAQLWAALSYRRTIDISPVQDSQFVSPIVGVNVGRFMFSYTYTKQFNDVIFNESGFHQVTLGLNVFCREQRGAACPNINSSFGAF